MVATLFFENLVGGQKKELAKLEACASFCDDARLDKLSVDRNRRLRPLQANYTKGLILAQNERWRRGLGMQVEREP